MSKVFCRCFQGVMKTGMYVLPWRMPKILDGPGSVKRLPALIRENGYSRVLIVTGPVLMGLHQLDPMLEALKNEEI